MSIETEVEAELALLEHAICQLDRRLDWLDRLRRLNLWMRWYALAVQLPGSVIVLAMLDPIWLWAIHAPGILAYLVVSIGSRWIGHRHEVEGRLIVKVLELAERRFHLETGLPPCDGVQLRTLSDRLAEKRRDLQTPTPPNDSA